MNKNTKITVKKELRATIRDKKSLAMMLITPLFVPVFVFFFSYFYDSLMKNQEVVSYTVGNNYALTEEEKEIIDSMNIEIVQYEESELQKAYENGEIIAYIILKDDKYNIYANPNSSEGASAVQFIMAYLEGYNNYLGQLYLLEIEINPENVFGIISYEAFELKGSSDMVDQIILMAFVFAIMSITLSATYSAIDSTAGEKERGTLETLLTFPIKSKDLVVGKYLATLFTCLVTAVICGILLTVSLLIAQNIYNIYEGVELSFGIGTIVLSVLILVGYSLFASGVSIAIASFSKTYKEAQSALTPLTFVTMIPMFMGILGVEVTPIIAIIPVINHTMLLYEIFAGNINLLHIVLMLISTIVCVIIVIRYIVWQYRSEKVLFSL